MPRACREESEKRSEEKVRRETSEEMSSSEMTSQESVRAARASSLSVLWFCATGAVSHTSTRRAPLRLS